MRVLTSAMKQQKNLMVTESATVWLFRIEVDDSTALYYTNNTRDIVFNSQNYTHKQIKVDTLKSDGSGDLDSWKLQVENVDRVMSVYLESGGLINRGILGWIVNTNLLSSSSNRIPMRVEIISAVCDREWCILQTGMNDIRRIKIPMRVYHRDLCRFRFGDADCQKGGGGTCDKRAATCLNTHNNFEHFGGFPSMPTVHR